MTPQGHFMVAGRVRAGQEDALRALLATMNHAPGVVDPANGLVPFGGFARLHVARFAVLTDNTLDDLAAHGAAFPDAPLWLVFIGDCDGDGAVMLAELSVRAEAGLRRIFALCDDPPEGDLLAWMRTHSHQPAAQYVNWIGRSVARIREEQMLHAALRVWLRDHAATVADQPAVETRERLIAAMMQAGRAPAPETKMPLRWRVRNCLHLLSVPVLLLALSPLLLVGAPFYLFILRRRETADPVITPLPDPDHVAALSEIEDHFVSNQFTGFGSLKPGRFRLYTLMAALWLLNYALRHIYTRGRLARVGTIHFARWVFMDNDRRLFFATNYDASLDSYMDDFINKVAYGLNLVFSNGIGWPRTRWLLFGGASIEQEFKYYLRRHQLPAQVWYKAYPDLSAADLAANSMIRAGFQHGRMSEAEARRWLSLI